MTTSNTPIYASQARPWLKFYDQKYIDQTMPACTAFELVCRQNKNRLGETALEYYGRKFTYADFIVNVKKTAAALRAAGLKKGDIATVVSVMTPEIIFAFYAADMIGATLNLVDPRYSVEGIREYIEEVDSHLLICLNVVYERCHQAAKRTHADGRVWVHTGDIGYLDEDGFVYLDSRIKRLIIRHDGFKVFPSMIENVVSQHPAVHQCSVVGCADKEHVQGRLPFVYLVLDPAVPAAKRKQIIKELRQLCIEELPEYVQPVGYKIIPEMPLTLAAKFDYRKLEEEITPRDY